MNKLSSRLTLVALTAASVLLGKSIEAQFMPDFEPQSVRLKDIGKIQTVQDVQLIGYGLITGLEGNGDGRGAPFTVQSLANLMRNMGVEVDPGTIRAKNAASVMVTARISPTSRAGSSIDVTVSSLGDAASLQGGILLMTPLSADPPSGPIVAIAQGPVSIGGFNAEGAGGGSVTKNHPVVGRIPNGAIVQQEIAPAGTVSNVLTVTIRDPDYTTAARLAHAIDKRFGRPIAAAISVQNGVLVPLGVLGALGGRAIDLFRDDVREGHSGGDHREHVFLVGGHHVQQEGAVFVDHTLDRAVQVFFVFDPLGCDFEAFCNRDEVREHQVAGRGLHVMRSIHGLRVPDVCVTPIPFVEAILPLYNHTQMLVVENDHFDRDLLGIECSEFLDVHHKGTVTINIHDELVRTCKGGTDRLSI